MKKIIVFIFIFINFFFLAKSVLAVVFATNTIILYENGKRVTDSSVIYGEYYYDPVCKNGVCHIGQQYTTVTFYKTKNKDNFNYDDWIKNWNENHKCKNYENDPAVSNALAEWRRTPKFLAYQQRVNEAKTVAEREKIWDESTPDMNKFMQDKGFVGYGDVQCTVPYSDYEKVYLPDVMNKAVYVKHITFPVPTGGAGCGYTGCIGGRIGNDTNYKVDLITGSVTQVTNPLVMLKESPSDFFLNLLSKIITFISTKFH